MKVAFTICSNNYIAQASILAESFKHFHPDYYFAIVLVDELSAAVDYASIRADAIVPLAELAEYKLPEIYDRYSVIELNTAVKPFVFQFFRKKFPDAVVMYYFDPDLKFFTDINAVTAQLQTASVVLTPHILAPIPRDGATPTDQDFLNYGLYNLGFLGLNPQHPDIPAMLAWWGDRTFHLGYNQPAKGLFVDQLWMNLVPLFYRDAVVSFDRGMNMGPWNLHERGVASVAGNHIVLTNGDTLKFYHFSSYRVGKPEELAHHYNRFGFADVGLLRDLYADYLADLKRHHMAEYSKIRCAFTKPPVVLTSTQRFKKKLRGALKKIAGAVLD